MAVSCGLWWRGFLPCAATTSPGGPGSYRGFPVWRCLAGCGGMVSFLASQGFARRAGHPPLVHPPGVLRCLEESGPPGDWFSRHVPLAGVLLRRRPPGELFSCKGFPSIPSLRTSSPPPRTINVTPVTNFVTPRPDMDPHHRDAPPKGRCTTATPSFRKGPSHMVRAAHPTRECA